MSEIFEKFKAANNTQRKQMLKTWDIEYYNNDAPTISDEEYDRCLAYYNSVSRTKHTSSLGSASNKFPKFEHTYPVLSLEKIVTKPDFMKAAAEFDYKVVIEPKLDGLTVVYYPDGKLVTRGNGHVGEVLNAERNMPGLPAPYTLPIRLEAVITKGDFEAFFKEDSQKPRNLAAGILRRKPVAAAEMGEGAKNAEAARRKHEKNLVDLSHITYYAYNILGADDMSEEEQMNKLRELGFKVPEVMIVDNEADLSKAFDDMETWSKSQAYDTDGAVVKANIAKNVKDFGSTAHHPNNAFAFKFVSMTEHTTLRRIRWSMGYDRLTPVAQFDDVVLGGSNVIQASLHNLNIMEQLGVKLGSGIAVTLKNEIIPQLVECDGVGEIIDIPKTCPCCGKPLIINQTKELVCENFACKAKFLDTMNRIAGKNGLDIEGMSNEFLDALYRTAKAEGIELASPFAFLELDKEMFRKAFDLIYITKARISDEILQQLKQAEQDDTIEMDMFAEEKTELYYATKDAVDSLGLRLLDSKGKENPDVIKRVRDIIAENMEFYPFEQLISAEDRLKAEEIHERPLAATLIGEMLRKKNNVLPANFLFANNVPELGINTAKLILKYYKDLDDFLDNWSADSLDKDGKPAPKGLTIEGIGGVIYASIDSYLTMIRKNMQYVSSFAPNTNYVSEADKEKEAAKLRICISGKLSRPKSYYEKLIVASGNTYVTSVTKELDYLATNETNTSKVVKAQKYGVKILTEEELAAMLESL